MEPWRTFYPAHAKALGTWWPLNGSREKLPHLDLCLQTWAIYNLRLRLAWDLAGAWTPFGGVSAQLTHLGLIPNMSVIENATIAMTYAKHFREQAARLAPQRTTAVNWAQFLAEEDDVINRNAPSFPPAKGTKKGGGKQNKVNKCDRQGKSERANANQWRNGGCNRRGWTNNKAQDNQNWNKTTNRAQKDKKEPGTTATEQQPEGAENKKKRQKTK